MKAINQSINEFHLSIKYSIHPIGFGFMKQSLSVQDIPLFLCLGSVFLLSEQVELFVGQFWK